VSSESPKRLLFRQFAAVAKAVAHEHRLELLEALAQGERRVEILANRTGMSVANTSQHLQLMRRAGLIESRREGKFTFYRLSGPAVLDLLAALILIGERHVGEVDKIVRTYFLSRDELEPISRSELRKRIKGGDVQVIDVRPQDEFASGHLPNAINIPLEELEAQLAMLDTKKEIVAYCRGAYCVLSFDMVERLRARGFKARRLEDGWPEWQAAGLPVMVCGQGSRAGT